MPDLTRNEWLTTLHDSTHRLDAILSDIHLLRNSFYILGLQTADATLYRIEKEISSVSNNIHKAAGDAVSELLHTAEVGTYSTIATAVALMANEIGKED